jgi:hypothetical protein
MDSQRFTEIVRKNRFNREILARLPSLALPDCWVVSGALFQTVWNVQTGRAPEHGIKDYDVFYFDPDLSWEAEDAVIKRAAAHFSDLDVAVEVRNQARVHLWYAAKFTLPYPPLTRSTDGIDRFLMHNAQVGVRPDGEIYAPRRFDDIAAMIIRPNYTANFHPDRYMEKALRWNGRWPELTILPAQTEDVP